MQTTSKSSGGGGGGGGNGTSKTDPPHAEPGSIMEQIQTLIQPPPSEEKSRSGGSKRSIATSSSLSSSQETMTATTTTTTTTAQRRYGRTSNHDRCDGCGEGGDLICCDRCPAAFHLYCCEPPMDRDDVPSGEWLCRKCNPPDVRGNGSCSGTPFDELIRRASNENPVAFSLPFQYRSNTVVPGVRKRKSHEGSSSSSSSISVQRKNNNKDKKGDESSGTDQIIRNHCCVCNRTIRSGNGVNGDGFVVQCDFCPLQYHLDCLDPPRTTMPSGSWMCPRHAELMHPDFASDFLSKREAVLDKMRAEFCRHETKIDFLDKVHSMKHHGRQVRHTKRTAVEIPAFVQDAYRNPMPRDDAFPTPSFAALCEAAALAQNPDHVLCPAKRFTFDPLASPVQERQDEWLREVIYFQCEASRYLSVAPEIRWRSRRKTSPEPQRTFVDNSKPLENGVSSDNEETVAMETDGDQRNDGKVSPAVSMVSSDVFLAESRPLSAQEAILNDHGQYALPDLELLHPDMVKVLAQQRLQQILTPKDFSSKEQSSKRMPPAAVTKPKLQHLGEFKKGSALLCPLGEGYPFAINRQTTTIGLHADCDIVLGKVKKCERQSDMHACIIHDKTTNRFELLNYSEFGTTVDGVNYSIGTSKPKSKRLAPVSITTYDIRALGTGPRAKRALAKVDSARRKWGTSSHAKAFLDILLKQSSKEEQPVPATAKGAAAAAAATSPPNGTTNNRRDATTQQNKTTKSPSPPSNNHVNPTVATRTQTTRRTTRRQQKTTKMPPPPPPPPSSSPSPPSTDDDDDDDDDETCSCVSATALEHSGWTGAAALHHGSVVQFGCTSYVFSVARQPGHGDLLDAVLSVLAAA